MHSNTNRKKARRTGTREQPYQPPVVSTAVTLGATLLPVAAFAGSILELSVIAATGTILVGFGLVRGDSTSVTVGSTVLFSSVLLAGILSLPVGIVVIAAVGTVVGYGGGQYAVRLGSQMTPETSTWRVELLHHGVMSIAIGGAGVVGTVLFLFGPVNLPVAALVMLLLAAVLLLWTVHSTE